MVAVVLRQSCLCLPLASGLWPLASGLWPLLVDALMMLDAFPTEDRSRRYLFARFKS
jgi:hypothetical protein